jgi:hypothetical protein
LAESWRKLRKLQEAVGDAELMALTGLAPDEVMLIPALAAREEAAEAQQRLLLEARERMRDAQ